MPMRLRKFLILVFVGFVGFFVSFAVFHFAVFPNWTFGQGTGVSSIGFVAFVIDILIGLGAAILAYFHL